MDNSTTTLWIYRLDSPLRRCRLSYNIHYDRFGHNFLGYYTMISLKKKYYLSTLARLHFTIRDVSFPESVGQQNALYQCP